MDSLYDVLDYFLDKNIKMGIITNGESNFQNTKIDKLGLRKYMTAIIISDEVGVRKPNSDVFNIALSKIGSKKETTLYVGDNPVNDIKGAIYARLIPIWLSNGKTWDEDTFFPRCIINSLAELILMLT